MACFFGSSEVKDKENRLNSEITSLKKEVLQLKAENEELQSQLLQSTAPSPTPSGGGSNDNEYEMAELKKQLNDITEERDKLLEAQQRSKKDIENIRDQMSKLENRIKSSDNTNNAMEDLKAENSMLLASQKLLKEKDKEKQIQIDALKKQLTEANTNSNRNNGDDDIKEAPKKKKYKMNKLEDQIECLYSEKARLKSMVLIMQPQYIQKGDNETRNFSFLQFLDASLSDKVIDQLYSKFKSDTVDEKQLASLLTLSVIIYKVKLHKMRTGDKDKPKNLDSASIKQSVEHFTSWIIRSYGHKTNNKKQISIKDDDGKRHNGEYYVYNAKFDKKSFGKDLKLWAKTYIENDGHIQLESS